MQLWRELRAQGYTGSASRVRPYIALLRQVPDHLLPGTSSHKQKPFPKGISVRRIIWLTLAQPEQLTSEQIQELSHVKLIHPEVASALTLAQAFVHMVREKNAQVLPAWLASAQASSVRELRRFAQGLERDHAAVEAALSRAESNGQVEGHITRLKLIKCEMYGRAKFDLLRLRVLHAA